jgi:NADPH:quinone reductase-like Zn-dependent oxidoreductase
MLGSLATLGLFLVLPGKRLEVSAIDRAFRREPERIRDLVRDLVDLLARNQIAPQIGLELPLERAAEAHALLQRGAVAGKIVLRLD